MCRQWVCQQAIKSVPACLQAQELCCPVKVVIVLDKSQDANSLYACDMLTHEAMRDMSGWWPQLSGVGDTGAVLVRPDGHVAWRCKVAAADQIVVGLRSALQTCLCK